ncbi:collagen alpha-1(I) chain-like [Felis catus]|uniref:collagen alpha-1(I) chain-like n=1 Tax=Felis catus TaxID=9685 RepID=UPI001D1A28F2|nr:collagen alpha-1(I) chain-like [Felis catus]
MWSASPSRVGTEMKGKRKDGKERKGKEKIERLKSGSRRGGDSKVFGLSGWIHGDTGSSSGFTPESIPKGSCGSREGPTRFLGRSCRSSSGARAPPAPVPRPALLGPVSQRRPGTGTARVPGSAGCRRGLAAGRERGEKGSTGPLRPRRLSPPGAAPLLPRGGRLSSAAPAPGRARFRDRVFRHVSPRDSGCYPHVGSSGPPGSAPRGRPRARVGSGHRARPAPGGLTGPGRSPRASPAPDRRAPGPDAPAVRVEEFSRRLRAPPSGPGPEPHAASPEPLGGAPAAQPAASARRAPAEQRGCADRVPPPGRAGHAVPLAAHPALLEGFSSACETCFRGPGRGGGRFRRVPSPGPGPNARVAAATRVLPDQTTARGTVVRARPPSQTASSPEVGASRAPRAPVTLRDSSSHAGRGFAATAGKGLRSPRLVTSLLGGPLERSVGTHPRVFIRQEEPDIMMEHPVTGDKSPDAKANGRENYSGVPEGITEH